MRSTEQVFQAFRHKGLKVTPQRRTIVELLAGDGSHPTAEEIYQRVRLAMPDISRTTVYHTLHELSELGELSPVQDLSEGGQRYDTNTSRHHHLYCVQCHSLIDVERNFEGVALPDEDRSGYHILRRQVTFYGICPDCQAANERGGT